MFPLLCARGFLFVSLFVRFWQIHSLSLPYSVLNLRDLTHTGCISQTPASPGWLLGLARGKHWQEREEKSQSASLRLSHMAPLLHLRLPLRRSALVLASAQRFWLTPGLLQPHFFVSVVWGGVGFWSRESLITSLSMVRPLSFFNPRVDSLDYISSVSVLGMVFVFLLYLTIVVHIFNSKLLSEVDIPIYTSTNNA